MDLLWRHRAKKKLNGRTETKNSTEQRNKGEEEQQKSEKNWSNWQQEKEVEREDEGEEEGERIIRAAVQRRLSFQDFTLATGYGRHAPAACRSPQLSTSSLSISIFLPD